VRRPVVTVVLVAIATATLLDSDGALAAAQQVRYPVVRVPLVDALRPVDAVAGTLRLTAPGHALGRALGNPPMASSDTDPNGLAAKARALAANHPAVLAPAPTGPPPTGPPPSGSPPSGSPPAGSPPAGSPPAGSPPAGTPPAGTPGAAGPAAVPFVTAGPPGAALPVGAAGAPLRVLVTGDSTAGQPGYALSDLLGQSRRADLDVRDEPYAGTGLVRPDAFDWSRKASEQAADFRPDVVVVFLGENDGYPLAGASPYSTDWAGLYAARIEAVIGAYQAGGVRLVIWAAPPVDAQTSPYEGSEVNVVFRNIAAATRAAVSAIPGTAMVDQYELFSVDGRFATQVPDPTTGALVAGTRAADGSHLTRAGGLIVARLLLRYLDQARQHAAPAGLVAASSPVPSAKPSPAPVPAGRRSAQRSAPAAPHRSTAPLTYGLLAGALLFRYAPGAARGLRRVARGTRRQPPARAPASRPAPLPALRVIDTGPVHPGSYGPGDGVWGRAADGTLLRCTAEPGRRRARWRRI
jgi:uncharacterized protein